MLNKPSRQSILLLLFTTGLCLTAMCQNSLVGSFWQNGSTFVKVLSENNSAIITVEADLHEGGNAQPWLKSRTPNLFFRPNQIGNAWTDTVIYYHDSIVHKTIAGQEALLVYGREHNLVDILLRYDGRSKNKFYTEFHGFDSILESNIRLQLIGSYRTLNMQAWLISPDSIHIFSLSSLPSQPSESYAYSIFWGETDCPEDIIVLSDGRKLCFKLSSDGISLFNGISHFEPDSNGFEWISIGDPLCHLIKTNLDNTVPGRWPEASMSLLTRGYLANYPVDVLRLIRNEIFARHGHRFSNQKLNDFFLSEGIWYSTALLSQQSPTELSEIELLNVQLILSLEKERKQRTDL